MDDKQYSRKSSLEINVSGGGPVNGEVKQIYKQISEDKLLETLKKENGSNVEVKKDQKLQQDKSAEATDKETKSDTVVVVNGDTTMVVQAENSINDGADEQMLNAEESEKLAEKREEVKFIKGDHQNGDAKIDISTTNGKTFTGMTKEELMKYANDPFWVRLRWIFFVGFWAIWVGMLVGAILIIIDAPKCAAPEPLPWFKRGLLAKFNSFEASVENVNEAKNLQATGAIYELPAELTYSVKQPEVEQKIKDIVAKYKDSKINVILDITPNYVTRDSTLMRNALADETKRSAFVWIEKPTAPNNWLSIVNGSAWAEVQSGNFVLSQFGDNLFDLHMNDTIVKQELDDVLKHLLQLGVKGFRLKNSKFFLISKNIQDEVPASNPKYDFTQYGFWTHTQTTFQEGLGDVLYEYMALVKNISADAFLSVAEDIIRPSVYRTRSGEFGIDMPMYGRFAKIASAPGDKNLKNELLDVMREVPTWVQWNFGDFANDSHIDASAFELFMSLVPGVPVVPIAENYPFKNVNKTIYKHIEQLRLSPSYMHGQFDMYNSDVILAYSRIKTGSPGYFVLFNPTDTAQKGNFTNLGLPEKMTVDIISENYNVADIQARVKVMTDMLEVSPYATIILTYVPVKSE